MNSSPTLKLIRDSTLIGLLLAVPLGVFANSISDQISAQRPNWLYVLAAFELVSIAILARVSLFWRQQANGEELTTNPREMAVHEVRSPGTYTTLGAAMSAAQHEVFFMGISAKRSVTSDDFRRALDLRSARHLRLRILLTDPASSAYVARAREEGEDHETWKADYGTTVARLKSFKDLHGLDVELRLTNLYPIWRAIGIDNNTLLISHFLPGKRGTESLQFEIHSDETELAYGWFKYFQIGWKEAKEVPL
ncbi:hypothetical protein ACWDSJ_04680 [Nocardia sp. NPDC003482]